MWRVFGEWERANLAVQLAAIFICIGIWCMVVVLLHKCDCVFDGISSMVTY